MIKLSFKSKLVIATCTLLALTTLGSMAASGWFFVSALETALKDKLQSVAIAVASFVDVEEHERLKTTSDMQRPGYQKMIARLHTILVQDPTIKFIYTLRPSARGPKKFTFVLDGGSAGMSLDLNNPDFSKIGDPYDKLPAEAIEVMKTGMPAVDRSWAKDQWGVTISGYAPIKDARGRVLAILGVDIIAEEVAATLWNAKMTMAFAVVIALIVGFAVAGVLAGRILDPIQDLHRATMRVANGDFKKPIEFNRTDELGAVLGTFNRMMQHVERAQQMSAEQARLKSQLEVAASVQTQLFQWEEIKTPRVEIGYFVRTAETMGGDWAHYHVRGDRHLYLIVSDVAGHGTAPAMVAAAVAGSFHGLKDRIDSAPEAMRPAQLIEYMRPVVEAAGGGRFPMTAFVALVDLVTGECEYANAGHVPGRLVRCGIEANGTLEHERKIETMPLPSNFLGAGIFETIQFKTKQLAPGDMLVLFSDGLVERRDPEGKVFGARRLDRVMKKAPNEDPVALCAHLVSEVNAYAGPDAPDDDITLLIARFPKEACASFGQKRDEVA